MLENMNSPFDKKYFSIYILQHFLTDFLTRKFKKDKKNFLDLSKPQDHCLTSIYVLYMSIDLASCHESIIIDLTVRKKFNLNIIIIP